MTLRHLAIFIKVCEENGITAAAKKLHMTQPSVSQVIQELEAHYQTLLFERLGRRIFITEAGRRLLRYSRNLINLNELCVHLMKYIIFALVLVSPSAVIFSLI